MIDRYTKIVLTIIAVNLTLIVADAVLSRAIPDAWAQQQSVWVDGGNLRVTSVGYVGGGTLDVNVVSFPVNETVLNWSFPASRPVGGTWQAGFFYDYTFLLPANLQALHDTIFHFLILI